ncbi:MAG: hypothetical protein OXG35_06240 [Acidobacteria bacterium]|nr:hypothetical protein [Acidobacteriota bacterium]
MDTKKAKRGRPAIDTTELRRHTYGVRLNDAEKGMLLREAERLKVRPTTALRTLALERVETRSGAPHPADIRLEIHRLSAVLQALVDKLGNRRIARRPDTWAVQEVLRETATVVGQVLANGRHR